MANEKIRVLIVDDSSLMRSALRMILEGDPSIEVIGVAKDGKEGVEKALALRPNVITMDLKMPVISGLEAIEEIMEDEPIPIIVVSSTETSVVMKALTVGAMDFVTVNADIESIAAELITKVKIASRVKPLRRMKLKSCQPQTIRSALKNNLSKVVVIGVSTGGPQALQVVLSRLPKDFRHGILIVQHMSKGFIDGLAEWLRNTSCLDVRVANAGNVLKSGQILLAPDDYNMYIDAGAKIVLKENISKTALHIPSIDETMKSVAEVFGENAIGVLMTGMGSDGVEGMAAIKKAGGFTIAQDESSSVVFGMNKVAIERGHVKKVVPLHKISDEIAENCKE